MFYLLVFIKITYYIYYIYYIYNILTSIMNIIIKVKVKCDNLEDLLVKEISSKIKYSDNTSVHQYKRIDIIVPFNRKKISSC